MYKGFTSGPGGVKYKIFCVRFTPGGYLQPITPSGQKPNEALRLLIVYGRGNSEDEYWYIIQDGRQNVFISICTRFPEVGNRENI